MRIGIDVDDVLFPFTENFKDFSEAYYSKQGDIERSQLPVINKWNFFEDWGITKEELFFLFNEFTLAGGYEKGIPMRGSRGYVRSLAKEHDIYIITARGSTTMPIPARYEMMASTIKWLEWYAIPYTGVIFTPDKGMIDLDILLDDNTRNLQSAKDSGIRSICFNQLWNQDWQGERVGTWREFHDLMQEIT